VGKQAASRSSSSRENIAALDEIMRQAELSAKGR
jgi:hypothetical protein